MWGHILGSGVGSGGGGYWEEHCTPNESPLPEGLGQALGSIESQFLISGAKKKDYVSCAPPPHVMGRTKWGKSTSWSLEAAQPLI